MSEQIVPVLDGSYTVPFFINGEEYRTERSFDVTSPATGKVVHKCSSASSVEADAAVDAAAAAFKTWRKASPGQRRDIFLKAAEIMEKRRSELSEYIVAETAAVPGFVDFNLKTTIDMIKDVAGRIATVEGMVPFSADEGQGAMVWKEPYGVVLAIAPWNAPYILGTRAVAFPIAAGNTVVFKGSELSPRVMWAIASVFHEAGLPKGVLNFIAHEPANAPAITKGLIEHPQVKKINFTGSTAVGRIIGSLAGQQLKPVVLELGGKAPAIVWEDADLDLAALQCTLGSFLHAGQICMATERILVHKNVVKEFEQKLVATSSKIFGDALVLIGSAPVDKNKRLIQDATSKGGSVILGDPSMLESTATRMRPVVIKNVTPEMDIYQTESFGPTVSLIEIETEEEALRIANDTEYGLSSSIFTEDLRRGLRMAKEIETGAVHINGSSVHDESCLPHGGAKGSGYGRFNSIGLNEWVRTKNVTWRN